MQCSKVACTARLLVGRVGLRAGHPRIGSSTSTLHTLPPHPGQEAGAHPVQPHRLSQAADTTSTFCSLSSPYLGQEVGVLLVQFYPNWQHY